MPKILNNKKLFILTTVFASVAILAVVFLLPQTSFAQDDSYGLSYAQNVGLSTQDLRTSVIQIIRNILGVLGILALIIILYGGFVYMTSRGDAQKVELAKKILLNAAVGLVIIMMAFGIVSWILGVLSSGLEGSSGAVCNAYECSGCARCNSDGTGYNPDNSCDSSCSGILPSSYFSISDVQTAHGTPIPGSHDDDEDKSNVYWCSKIQTIFNHDVAAGTVSASVNNNSLYITAIGLDNAAGNYTTRGNVLSFTPENYEFINRETEHASHLPNSLEDTLGLMLTQCSITASCDVTPPPEARWDFYIGTEGDDINPHITSTYPISDTTNTYYPDANVSRDPTLQVNFSEAIDYDTVFDISGSYPNPSNIFIYQLDDDLNRVQLLSYEMWDIQPEDNGFIIYLNNSNLLEGFTNYEVTVQNIRDLCGNVMDPNPYSWRFITNDVVPGINSFYPQGSNICPDTQISLSYNTSMYANQIIFSIQNPSGNPSIYILEPSGGLVSTTNNIGSGNIAGTFRVIDQDLSNINNNYRIYEFIPTNNLAENTIYTISYTTDKVIDINGNTLDQYWNFTVADMATCVCTPYISYLSKEQGPAGDCLTINGQCFLGTQTQPAVINHIYFNNTDALVGNGYTANTVGTTVPLNFSLGDRPQVSVVIDYESGNSVPDSNTKDFLITAGQATGPCLWSINPNYGQPGETNVSLSGIRFGAYLDSSIHQVIFNNNQVFTVSEATNWDDTRIQNVAVPANTIDGDVVVVNAVGTSNAIPFDAHYCGDNIIDPGENCDGINLNGQTCIDVGYLGGNLNCNSSCQFDTSACSNAPQVLENSSCLMLCNGGDNAGSICSDASQCPDGSCQIETPPSPNPYGGSQNVCLNISLQADFNTDILAATLNTTNIYLTDCGADSSCSDLSIRPLAAITSITNRSFILTPNNYLLPNHWYQGTITTGVRSTADVAMQENYIWRFKTKADSALCPLENVHLTPDNIDNASSVTDYPYSASATGPYCVVLQGDYDWTWSINDPTLEVTVTEDLFNDANATVLTATEKGTTYVRTEAEGKYDTGRLNINFDTCTYDSDCTDPDGDGTIDCPGSVCDIILDRCTPVINSLDPATGPVGRWVTLNGCHFKSFRGSGDVYFGSTEVTNYPCNEVWQDNQIIVTVPDNIDLGLNPSPVTVIDTYGLDSSNSRDFNIINECLVGVATPTSGVPGVCALSPNSGVPQTNVSIAGENFGNIAAVVNFGTNQATTNSWLTQSISAVAPTVESSGTLPVTVEVAGCPSNSFDFTYLPGAVDDPCDGNIDTTECDANNNMCWAGLYCEATATSCSCQAAPNVNVIATTRYPYPSTVCRNAVVGATFDDLVVPSSLDIELWQRVMDVSPNASCIYSGTVVSENNITKNKVVQFINFIKNWFNNIFYPTAQAQITPRDVYWCPVSGYTAIQDVATGVEGCESTDGCTKFVFSPVEPLATFGNYRLHIRGGATGAKTIYGAELNTNLASTVYFDDPSYYWSFTVDSGQVCEIDYVNVDVSFRVNEQTVTRDDATYDFYTCAGRNDCADDVGIINGNQHDYLAQAYSNIGGPIVAAYEWTEYDTENLIEINSTETSQTLVTANPYEGKSIIRVEASDPNPADEIIYGEAITSINVTNFICENPWPSLTTFPLEDFANNCTINGLSCHDMTFSTYYCRDYGHDEAFCLGGTNNNATCTLNTDCPDGTCVAATADDLPVPAAANLVIKGEQQGFCVGGSEHGQQCSSTNPCADLGYCYNTLKEYMYNFDQDLCLQAGTACLADTDCPTGDSCQTINDSIGIRIYNNQEHLSPASWYQKYANQPGSFTTKSYDGYEAIASGRTTYIGMAVDNLPLRSVPIYTDMFLMSYTDNYDATTLNIHDQLLNNLTFNINGVDDVRICSSSNIYCEQNSDCPSGEECNADKTKLARDTIRMGHLSEIIYHLDLYRGYCSAHQNLSCLADTACPDYLAPGYPTEPTSEFCIGKNNNYPLLEAGTYISGQSTSIWDSWNNTFASLLGASPLLDPLNEVFCDYNADYNEECWNQDTQNFSCDATAHFYNYISTDAGNSYSLRTKMEYSDLGWVPSPTLGSFSTISGCYSLQYQR